jgi:hypothetical protein
VSGRAAWAMLSLLAVALAAIALTTNLASASGGRFWGDGATYHAMAWSLAEDGDIRYEAKDVFRSRREFAEGPQGIFLKRASGGLTLDGAAARGFPWVRRVGPKEPRIYFAKPFLYPAVAAPFVRFFGTHALLLVNALALSFATAAGYSVLCAQASPALALAASAAIVLGGVAPLYLLWPAPEALGVGLAAAGLLSWHRGRSVLAAVLFGVTTYGKPPNVLLAIPLCLEPLLDRASPWSRRLLRATGRGALVLAVAAALYGVNWAATGEWNYQGGSERKTFYGKFPFETYGVTFGNSGIWMSTNQVGPSIEGIGAAATSQGAEPPRSAHEVAVSFVRNLGYFWIGRFGGVVPYFLPVAVALAALLLLGPRGRHALLALVALLVSQVAYIAQIPDNWYGGSGTLGNRYFLNLLPLAFFLVPRGREMWIAASGLVSVAAFTGALLLAPMANALDPGGHTIRAPYRWFPAELTMLNDLSVFAEPWRKKVPIGDPWGKPGKPETGDPSAYFLYFPDNGTFGREELDGRLGFWVRGGRSAEVFVRAIEPVRRMTLLATGGVAGDELTARLGSRTAVLTLRPSGTRNVVFEPPLGFPYKDTFVYVLRLDSTRGAVDPARHDRVLGSFVSLSLEVEKRPPH